MEKAYKSFENWILSEGETLRYFPFCRRESSSYPKELVLILNSIFRHFYYTMGLILEINVITNQLIPELRILWKLQYEFADNTTRHYLCVIAL